MTIALFTLYAVATAALALWSSRQTGSSSEFAVGSGKMNPWVAGIALGACLASSATFVIMPGFVYADGLPALIGFSLPLLAGLGVGLFALSFRFQEVGKRVNALTIPHWLGERYDSWALRRFFGALNILNLAYLVLVTVGAAYVMKTALGVEYRAAVLGIVTFVFGYTALGGATAHAWTNALQGAVMLVVATIIGLSGAHLLPEVATDLASTGLVDEGSVLFSTHAEVWLVPFLMGLALTTQPHLLSKALYVEDAAAVKKTLTIGIGAFAVYCVALLAGAYARLVLPEPVAQDQVVAAYLAVAFAAWPVVGAIVNVAILAAAMSTLDGLLVAISASVGNDLVPGERGLLASRLTLVGLAIGTAALALNPPGLVLIFGQLGVYGLVVASAGPLLVGLFRDGPLDARVAFTSAITALVLHFGLSLQIANPGVTGCIALTVAVPLAFLMAARAPAPATTGVTR
ncbi:MAG: hypothetical protein EP330_06940 [Deltaproteobacteria bacterium]|nr:MAG: hypothetical protein EP330_06940 [Deltaproteobacteria bacterium]